MRGMQKKSSILLDYSYVLSTVLDLHHIIQLRSNDNCVDQIKSPALTYLPGCSDKTSHGCTIERTCQADPLDASLFKRSYGEWLTLNSSHKVQGLRYSSTNC